MIAALLGASVIEKHLTLSNDLKGPDHKASLNPKFRRICKKIRNVKLIMGEGNKFISIKEKK